MAKFHGVIGYIEVAETAPGVYSESVTERNCSGDILRNTRRWEGSERVNDTLIFDGRFSIIADEFAISNVQKMRYIKILGSLWKIISFEIERPRIILTVGGVYNAVQN